VSRDRDIVLARLAAARGFAMRCANQLDELIELFLIPEEDPRGLGRSDLLEGITEDSGRLSRVIETAQAAFEKMDPTEPAPEESDDDEDVEEDERRAAK
jgi:hypothetical protein